MSLYAPQCRAANCLLTLISLLCHLPALVFPLSPLALLFTPLALTCYADARQARGKGRGSRSARGLRKGRAHGGCAGGHPRACRLAPFEHARQSGPVGVGRLLGDAARCPGCRERRGGAGTCWSRPVAQGHGHRRQIRGPVQVTLHPPVCRRLADSHDLSLSLYCLLLCRSNAKTLTRQPMVCGWSDI